MQPRANAGAGARLVLQLPLSFFLVACSASLGAPGTTTSVAEPSGFPSKESIAQIATAPVPARLFDDQSKDVATWDLVDPLPDALEIAPHEDASPWSKLLAEATAARGGEVALTEAMHCVAQQNAAFIATNEALPAEPLARFIAARCGAPTSLISGGYQSVKADERYPEEKLIENLRDQVKGQIERRTKAGRLDAGIGYARNKKGAVVTFNVAPQRARLERTPLVPGPDGNVVLRGELLTPTAVARASINRGRYGFAVCTPDRSISLPRFAFTCPTLSGDEAAWLTLSSVAPGHILGAPVVDMLVWPAGKPGKTYAKLTRTEGDAPIATASIPALVDEINRVRRAAGLSPVRLAEAESRTAALLAPHFFASIMNSSSDTVADQVALGIQAGWEVDGTVRSGSMVSTWLPEVTDYTDLIRTALTRPTGRETLLDPAAERVAIGTVGSDKDHPTGGLFATYSLFDSYRHEGDTAIVAGRITALRIQQGSGRPTMAADLNAEAARAAKSVERGARTPEEGMQDLVGQVSQRFGRSAHVWLVETTSLEGMKVPDALLKSRSLTFGVAVTHYRRKNHPWARLLIFCVALDDVTMTAQAGAPRAG